MYEDMNYCAGLHSGRERGRPPKRNSQASIIHAFMNA